MYILDHLYSSLLAKNKIKLNKYKKHLIGQYLQQNHRFHTDLKIKSVKTESDHAQSTKKLMGKRNKTNNHVVWLVQGQINRKMNRVSLNTLHKQTCWIYNSSFPLHDLAIKSSLTLMLFNTAFGKQQSPGSHL